MRSNLCLPVCACALLFLALNPLLAGQSAPAVTIVYRFTGIGTDNEDTFCFADTREHMGLSLLYARLAQGRDGNFYGTTSSGGSRARGTVFKITPAGVFTTLQSFTQNGADGSLPNVGLVAGSDGNLYGTTTSGGASYQGTVFKITLGGQKG